MNKSISKDKERNIFTGECQYILKTLCDYKYLLPNIINIVKQYISTNSLIILGGKDTFNTFNDSVILYDAENEDWVDLPPLPTKRYYLTSIVYDNKIYVMGGITPENDLDSVSVDMFDFSVYKWMKLANLNQKRGLCSSCLYHEKIYVIGGHDNGLLYLATIEVYDPKQPLLGWTLLHSKLNQPRSSLVSVVFKDTIYAIGGVNYDNDYLDSVEKYNSVNDTWHYTGHLNFGRSAFSAVSTEEYIYVMGGFKSSGMIDSVERSDMKSSFESIQSLPEETFLAGSALVNDTIYFVGGMSGQHTKKKISPVSTIFTMDLSDPNSSWSTINMPHPCYCMSCVSAPVFL